MVAVHKLESEEIPHYLRIGPQARALGDEDEVPEDLLDRPMRRDALPEHTRYADTGCDVHSACLTCPLVRCRYDEPGGARKLLSAGRDRDIVALQGEGVGVTNIAQRFGISRRTVFRVLAKART